jgi:hypothetical protein
MNSVNLTVIIPKKAKMNLKPTIDFNAIYGDDNEPYVPYNTPIYTRKRKKSEYCNTYKYEITDFKPYETIEQFLKFYEED